MDKILKLVSHGVEEVIIAVDKFINNTITDASWKEIVKTSLGEFSDVPNVLVYRLKAKIKGTAANSNYTAATLLESLHNWVPLTDEPFDRLLGHAPPTQNATSRDSITSPVTPTPALPILSQLSETVLEAPTPEPSSDDHTPDELQYTTKEWARYEFKDSGFLISVPSPDEWLDILPTDRAVLQVRVKTDDEERQETLGVEVDIDRLLTMTEENFVNSYIDTIVDKTTATSRGWLEKTAEVCQQRLSQLMLDRKQEVIQRRRERDENRGAHVIRTVRHLMAMANLTAASAAIERLHGAIAEWDRLLMQEEDADIVIGSINSPRASSSVS